MPCVPVGFRHFSECFLRKDAGVGAEDVQRAKAGDGSGDGSAATVLRAHVQRLVMPAQCGGGRLAVFAVNIGDDDFRSRAA